VAVTADTVALIGTAGGHAVGVGVGVGPAGLADAAGDTAALPAPPATSPAKAAPASTTLNLYIPYLLCRPSRERPDAPSEPYVEDDR
jgi:hypothetical protein